MDVKLNRNKEHNGLELIFEKKPSPDILSQVKEQGFRWHNQKKLWFAKETPERLAFAEKLSGVSLDLSQPETTYRYYSTQRPVDLGTYPKAGGAFLRFENFDQRQPVENGSFLAWGWLEYSRPLTEIEMSDYELRSAAAPDMLAEREAAFRLRDGKYLYIQTCDDGWDYTLYDKTFKDLDGGQLDAPEMSIREACSEILEMHSLDSRSMKKVSVDAFEERLHKAEQSALQQEAKKPNTFAAHYDSIGDARILKSSNISLHTYTQAYLEDIGCYYSRTYSGDSVTLTDLTNAGKTGKTCQIWHLYPESYNDRVTEKLNNEEGIQTCKELYQALKEDREISAVRVSPRDEKAVEVFSPFEEVKPLKAIPERWNKRNFAIAALSGQLFRGEVAYRYTDDYAMDAANNFGEGAGLHMPSFARRAVEDWGQLTSVSARGETPKDGVVKLSYSEHSNSCKTIWFDLNCDIAEGKRRAEERQAGLDRYNKMMEMSCIRISPDSIDPKKLYVLQQLERGDNTGRYGVKSENIPGYVLQDRIQEGYVGDILSAKPMDIQPDHIYEVSNFFHRPSAELPEDDRVIQCGNWKCIVFGKALMELIAEQQYLPHIAEDTHEYGPTFREAEAKLQRFANGKASFFVNNATDYNESLARLRSEHQRAAGKTGSLDDIIAGAAARTTAGRTSVDREKDFQR